MTISNRLMGYFTPHRHFSNKLPRLYLDSRNDPDDTYHLQTYFVNNSGLPLQWVELRNPLLYTTSMSKDENAASIVKYASVQPNEAVLVAEFDIIFDSDFLHELTIAWKTTGEPAKEARICGKGINKFNYKVLEWLADAP